MASQRPLPTLLSQALVAFTIEVDAEFEHQLPHRTTRGPAASSGTGPWLTSLAMWSNLMRYVDPDGVTLADLAPNIAMTNLAGLQRWGYLTVSPAPEGTRAAARSVVRPTRAGRHAQQVWAPLPALIEARWSERFGASSLAAIRVALLAVAERLDPDLPDYLPVVAHQLFSTLPPPVRLPRLHNESTPDLAVLLARPLLAFTLDVERDAPISRPIGANLLRVLRAEPQRERDLPRLAGVSKEAISISLGVLRRRGHAEVEPDRATGRGKLVRLTTNGRRAQRDHDDRVETVQSSWRHRFGADIFEALIAALDVLADQPREAGAGASLFDGLTPYDDGWRAQLPRPETLPHHPMVLHRGGFPDGS